MEGLQGGRATSMTEIHKFLTEATHNISWEKNKFLQHIPETNSQVCQGWKRFTQHLGDGSASLPHTAVSCKRC